jgi:hypothetical protein
MELNFKNWLVENAHRTGTRAANYPPQYDTHGFNDVDFPLLHMPTAADMLAYLSMKPIPFNWTSYKNTLQ